MYETLNDTYTVISTILVSFNRHDKTTAFNLNNMNLLKTSVNSSGTDNGGFQ